MKCLWTIICATKNSVLYKHRVLNNLSLNDIAQYIGLDPFYLSHIFSKEVGSTIHKYVVKKRLNLAKKKLDEGYNIKQIIKMIGFNDESHFIQTFKKEYNMTPNKYKNKIRQAK